MEGFDLAGRQVQLEVLPSMECYEVVVLLLHVQLANLLRLLSCTQFLPPLSLWLFTVLSKRET